MKIRTFLPIYAFLPTFISAVNARDPVKIQFDSSKEVPGKKFGMPDIMPGLPANRDEFDFAVLEYKISISQRDSSANLSKLPLDCGITAPFPIFGINKSE
jgi:hypothetical protein